MATADDVANIQRDDPQVGNAELIDRYERGIADLQGVVGRLTREQALARPIDGKLSSIECLGHIVDMELVYADRIQRTIALERPLLVSVDERGYFERLDYQQYDLGEQLALFTGLRRHVARLLHMQPAEAWQRAAVHSQTGLLTLRQLVWHPVRHLAHHLRFLEEKKAALAGNGP